MMARAIYLPILVARFLWAVLASGVATLRLILAARPDDRGTEADYQAGELGERGLVLLGALVCLTPGTTTLAIDVKARRLRLHLLDADATAETLAGIRRDLETPLARVLGKED